MSTKNDTAIGLEALATAVPRKAVALMQTSPRETYMPHGIGKSKPFREQDRRVESFYNKTMTHIKAPCFKNVNKLSKEAPFGGGIARNVSPLKHSYQATVGGTGSLAQSNEPTAYVKRKLFTSNQDIRSKATADARFTLNMESPLQETMQAMRQEGRR